MEFDFDKFLERLQGRMLSKQEATLMIYEEIREAESYKIRFLDQSTANADFHKFLGSQVDNYITYLKALHNKIGSELAKEPDEEIYKSDADIINRTLELVKQLEQVEKVRMGNGHKEPPKTNLNNTSADLGM